MGIRKILEIIVGTGVCVVLLISCGKKDTQKVDDNNIQLEESSIDTKDLEDSDELENSEEVVPSPPPEKKTDKEHTDKKNKIDPILEDSEGLGSFDDIIEEEDIKGLDFENDKFNIKAEIEEEKIAIKNIEDVNEYRVVFKPNMKNQSLLTIGDIVRPLLIEVVGATDKMTYYLSVEDTTNYLVLQTSETEPMRVVGGVVGASFPSIDLVQLKALPKTIIIGISVQNEDGNSVFASRKITIKRAEIDAIYSWDDLKAMETYTYHDYELKNNIIAPVGVQSIATHNKPFGGTFDGAGYEISSLEMNNPQISGQGLFAAIAHAEIYDLVLVDVDIQGKDNLGGLAGVASGSKVYRISVTGKISGNRALGGIIGAELGKSRLSELYFNGEVSGHVDIGGIAGQLVKSGVRNVLVKGQVLGKNSVGGIVGRYTKSDIKFVLVTANVLGNSDIGGIIGIAGFLDEGVEAAYYIRDIDNGINLDVEPVGYSDFNTSYDPADYVISLSKLEIKDKFKLRLLDFNNIWYMGDDSPELEFTK